MAEIKELSVELDLRRQLVMYDLWSSIQKQKNIKQGKLYNKERDLTKEKRENWKRFEGAKKFG